MAAEWEPQWGVQLTWPHEATDWQPYLQEITETYIEVAREIAKREKLIVVAPDTNVVRTLLEDKVDMGQVVLHECPTDDTWARDHGFLTLTTAPPEQDGERPMTSGKEEALVLLDFCFNGWGKKFEADNDNTINRSLFPTLSAMLTPAAYEDHLDFVLEGGSIESNGRGTLFTTSGCLMADNRNQPLTRREIEEQLLKRLHADRVLWIDHGHLAGDDTDGHIDTLVRIAPNDTLLYIGTDDSADEHYADLKAMESQLRTFRTTDGRPYRLLRLPMPEAICYDGERLPATYANYLVVNGAVLVPTYGQPALDRQAMDTIGQAYPDREIIGIDSRVIIRQHGSVHCCTMQYTKNQEPNSNKI